MSGQVLVFLIATVPAATAALTLGKARLFGAHHNLIPALSAHPPPSGELARMSTPSSLELKEAVLEARERLEALSSSADGAERLFVEANRTGCGFLSEVSTALHSMTPMVEALLHASAEEPSLPVRSWNDHGRYTSPKFANEVKTTLAASIAELASGCSQLSEAQNKVVEQYMTAKHQAVYELDAAFTEASGAECSEHDALPEGENNQAVVWPFGFVFGGLSKSQQARAALISAGRSLSTVINSLEAMNQTIVDAMVTDVLTNTGRVLDSFHRSCMQGVVHLVPSLISRAEAVCTKPSRILLPLAGDVHRYLATIPGTTKLTADVVSQLQAANVRVVEMLRCVAT